MDMEELIQFFAHPDEMNEFLMLHLELFQRPSAALFAYKKAQIGRFTRLRLVGEQIHTGTALDLDGLGIVAQRGRTAAHRITHGQIRGKGGRGECATKEQETEMTA